MALHLNYDGKQDNGIIFNDTYTAGSLFKGVQFKPTLSFTYDGFQMSEVFGVPDYVTVNGIRRAMTAQEAQEIKTLAISWVQSPEQEGGTTWLVNKAIADANRGAMKTVCILALQNAGYTEQEISLFIVA